MAVRIVCSVSTLCVEGPSRDTPEIASLRLDCAHPCAQTVPRGALDTESADGTRAVDGLSAVVAQSAPRHGAESAVVPQLPTRSRPNYKVHAA